MTGPSCAVKHNFINSHTLCLKNTLPLDSPMLKAEFINGCYLPSTMLLHEGHSNQIHLFVFSSICHPSHMALSKELVGNALDPNHQQHEFFENKTRFKGKTLLLDIATAKPCATSTLEMSMLTRDGTAEPVSRDQTIRRERG